MDPEHANHVINEKKYELDYVSIVLLLLIMLGIGVIFSLLADSPRQAVVVEDVLPTEEVSEEESVDHFAGLPLEAKAAYVYDVQSGKVLYSKNEEVQLPLASITKLMTALTASQYLEDDDLITIDYNALDVEGDSGLFAFEEWGAKDLLDYTLIVSSNDGAYALANAAGGAKLVRSGKPGETARGVFVGDMNDIAQEIGLTQTYFVNETGLDSNYETSGSYGSARDVAMLMQHIIESRPNIVSMTNKPVASIISKSNFEHTATNTNSITKNIPGLIASKTGFTDLAGGNLVVAFDAGIGRHVIVSVLGSSKEGRFSDVEMLVDSVFKALNQ